MSRMQLGLGSLSQVAARAAPLRVPRTPAAPRSAAAVRPRQHASRVHADTPRGGASGGSQSRDAVVRTARETQLTASELLAEFLQAADLEEAVKRRVALLDEAWFHTASTYLTLARRDGQQLVEAQLTTVLRAAADAKDATLRPEIRLLNALMRVATAAEREVLYERHSDFLVSDSEYFFGLLARMTSDVERQPTSPGQRNTLTMLQTISTEAARRKPTQGSNRERTAE